MDPMILETSRNKAQDSKKIEEEERPRQKKIPSVTQFEKNACPNELIDPPQSGHCIPF